MREQDKIASISVSKKLKCMNDTSALFLRGIEESETSNANNYNGDYREHVG